VARRRLSAHRSIGRAENETRDRAGPRHSSRLYAELHADVLCRENVISRPARRRSKGFDRGGAGPKPIELHPAARRTGPQPLRVQTRPKFLNGGCCTCLAPEGGGAAMIPETGGRLLQARRRWRLLRKHFWPRISRASDADCSSKNASSSMGYSTNSMNCREGTWRHGRSGGRGRASRSRPAGVVWPQMRGPASRDLLSGLARGRGARVRTPTEVQGFDSRRRC